MNDVLYGRRVEVVAGAPGKEQRKFNGDDFTISFDVPFNDDPEPNIANVVIYNLSEKTIVKLSKGTPIVINAGYKGDVGSIFLGNIQMPITEWSGVDKTTSLDCVDSGQGWYEKKVKKTYKKNISGQQILKDLLPLTKLKTGALKLPKNHIYKGGKTIDSTLANAIAEVAKDCGAKFHVNRKLIYVQPKNEGFKVHYCLDAAHGLIGTPGRIEKEIVTGKDKKGNEIRKTVKGWKIVSLLNHRFTTDAVIEVKSSTAKGMYRIESGVHNGDSFYTEMEVYPL